MSATKIKGYIGAFIVGGIMGVIGQLVVRLLLFLGLEMSDAAPLTVLIFAIIGAILTRLGIYQKLRPLGGAATMLPMSGLAGAVTEGTLALRAEGKPLGKAVAGGAGGPASVFVLGAVVGLVLAIVTFLIG